MERTTRLPLRRGRWLVVLVTAVCLAFSACYEFIEWWAALAGAIVAQFTLGRVHDRQIAAT